jgi:hypothetical protein
MDEGKQVMPLPAEVVKRLTEMHQEMGVLRIRFQDVTNTAAIVLGTPDGWRLDLQAGAFVGPDKEGGASQPPMDG